jgi:SAM-dependent methyltransferase
MNSFTAGWLALREPADVAARSATLTASSAPRTNRVVDLASGTGANIRYLAPRFPGVRRWLAVDRDPQLLAAAAWPAGANVAILQLDLARALDELPLENGGLVTASALLDLVSESWLRRLAARCAEAEVDVLFALTYDGRIEWSPADAGDERVRELLNRHQLRDKGFGPALGPGASGKALATFDALGYAMRAEQSDWDLGPESRALQMALVDGWASAASEIAPGEGEALREWAKRRHAHVAAGRSRLRVGHLDLAGQRR